MPRITSLTIHAKDHAEFGYKIGKKLAREIHARITTNKRVYKTERKKTFADLIPVAQRFLPAVATYHPYLIGELEAMSEGAKVSFDDLLVMMCEEELLDFKMPHCTNIAIRTDMGALLGHSEDWLPMYLKNGLYVVKGMIGKQKILALSYMGSLAGTSCGMNEKFCYTANSLNSSRFRYGVPIKFQMRALLENKTPQAAIRTDLKDSTIASNMMYVWKDSRIFDVEDYFGHDHTFHAKQFLIHTNHPLLKKDRTHVNTAKESLMRYARARDLLHAMAPTLRSLRIILRDHEAGICGHIDRLHPTYGITIATAIMNPKEQWMDVAWANSCTNPYKRYRLE